VEQYFVFKNFYYQFENIPLLIQQFIPFVALVIEYWFNPFSPTTNKVY